MQQLIQANGQPLYGVFEQTPQRINFRDFDFRSPMGRKLGALSKWRNFHQFQYFGLISPTLIGGCALAELSLVAVAFVYLYHPPSGRMLERRFKCPLGLGARFSQTPDEGVCELRQGRNRLRLENTATPLEKRLLVQLDDGTRIDARFSEAQPAFQPMSLCTPSAVNGWVYARKVAGVRCSGQVQSALGDFDLRAIDAFAHHDWSAGYMRRETFWNWACLSGEVQGQRVGLNLSWGGNETSFTENCFWLDGELLKGDSVRFEFVRDHPLRPWIIRSYDGQVSLRFEGQGLHQERLDLGLLASNFKQLFGRFSGTLRPHGGTPLHIENSWGFVEDQYAKW
jgi:hypothetical protein